MSVIIRLMGLSWSASAMDIRNFFTGLSIPPGGVRIIGGDNGDAFIAFSTDEDARQAMMFSNKLLNDCPVQLFLSSKAEMQNTITQAKDKTPTSSTPAAPVANTAAPLLSQQIPSAQQISQAFPSVGQIMGTLGLQQPQLMQTNQYQSGYQSNMPPTNIQMSSNFNNSNVSNTQTMPVITKAQQAKDKNVSPYEQALPGEYSVGGMGGPNKLLDDNTASQRQSGYVDQSYGSSYGEQRMSYNINQTDSVNQEFKPSHNAFGSNVSNDRFQGHAPYMQKTDFQSSNSNNQAYIGDHKKEISNPQNLNQTNSNMPFGNQQMFKSQSDNFSSSQEKPYQSDLANINHQDFGHEDSHQTDHNTLESHQTFAGTNHGYPPNNHPIDHNFASGSRQSDANFPPWNRPDNQKFPSVSRPSDSSYQRNIHSSESNIPPWSHLTESRMPPRDRQNDSNFPASSGPSESNLPPNESVVMPPNSRLNDSKFSTPISRPGEFNYPPSSRANESTTAPPKTGLNDTNFPHFVSICKTNESNFPPSTRANEPPSTIRRNDSPLKPSILSNKSPIVPSRTRPDDTSFPPMSHSSGSHMSSRGHQNDPRFVPIGPTRESKFAPISRSNESEIGANMNDPNIRPISQPTDQTVKPFQIRSKFGSPSSSTKSPTKPIETRPIDSRDKQQSGTPFQGHAQVSASTSDKLKSANNMPTVQSDVPAAAVALSDKRDEFGRNLPYSGRDNMSDSSRTPTQDEKSDELNVGRSRESNEGRSKDSNRRSSRDRDRSRERYGRRDSPRDRDRERRDRDRDRGRRDRDDDRKPRRDRDRDRDRDRKYRDREGDRYDRNREYKDGDRKNSPGNDSIRKGRKRSLSPSSKNKNDTEKKMQIEKPGQSTISKSTDKTDNHGDTPKSIIGHIPPLADISLPAQAPPDLPAMEDKEKKSSTRVPPLLPVTAPSKSRGLLGEAPNTLTSARMQDLNKYNRPPLSGPNFSGKNITDFKADVPGSGMNTIPNDFRRQGFQTGLSVPDPKLTPLLNINVPPPPLNIPDGRPNAPGIRSMEAPTQTFEYGHSDEVIRQPGIDITQPGAQINDKPHLPGPRSQRDDPMDIDEPTDAPSSFGEPERDRPPYGQLDFSVPPPGMTRLMMDFQPPGMNTVAPDRQDVAQVSFKDSRPSMRDGHPPFVNRNQMDFPIPPGRDGNSGRGAPLFNDQASRDFRGPPPGLDSFPRLDGPPGSRQGTFDERNKRDGAVRPSLLGDGGPTAQFTDMAEFIDIADQAGLDDEVLNDMNSRDFHGVPYRDEPHIDDSRYPRDFRNVPSRNDNPNARDGPRFGDRNALESRDVTNRDVPRGLLGDLPFENRGNFNRDGPPGRVGPPQDFRDRAQFDIGRERHFTDFHDPILRDERGYNSMGSSFRGQPDFDGRHPGDFRGPTMDQEHIHQGRFDSRRDIPFDSRGESDSRGPLMHDRNFYDRRPDSMRDIDMGQSTTRGVHREGDRNREQSDRNREPRNFNKDEPSMDRERGGSFNREGNSNERERDGTFHRDLPSSTDRERGGQFNRSASLTGRERSGAFSRDGHSTNDRERGGVFNREGTSTNDRERGVTSDRRERYDNRSSDNRVNSSSSRNRPNERTGDYRNKEQFNERNERDRPSSRDERKDSNKRESDVRRSSRFDDKSNDRKSSTTNTRSNTDSKVNSEKENDSKKDMKPPTDKTSDSKNDDKAIATDISKGTALCSVSLECIPIETTYKDIRRLFAGLELPKDGIKIINNKEGKRIGKAFIRFGSQDSFKKGLQKDRTKLGNKIMVVKPVSRNEFDIAIDSYLPPSEDDDDDDGESADIDVCNSLSATLRALKGEAELKLPPKKNTTKTTNEFVVKMTMLPDYVKATDIKTFFQGCQIARNGEAIVIESDGFNTCTGSCYAEFASEISFKRAMNRRKVFDRKTIVISQGTKKEVEDCVAKMKREIKKKSLDKVIDNKSTDDKAKSSNRTLSNEKSMTTSDNKFGTTNIKTDTNEPKLVTHVNIDNSQMRSVDEVISSIMNKDSNVADTEASNAPPVCTCLRIRNIPKTMKVFELRGLFEGLGITVKVAQICHDAVGKAIGEGYVEFTTGAEVEKTLVKNNTYIGKNKITVEPVTKTEMIENMRLLRQSLQPENSSNQAVFYFVKAANLPKNVSTGEIMNFFSGYHPAPESIRLNIGDGIEPQDASTALVGFRTREEAETAISSINGNMLRSKHVVLNKVIL